MRDNNEKTILMSVLKINYSPYDTDMQRKNFAKMCFLDLSSWCLNTFRVFNYFFQNNFERSKKAKKF